MVTGRNRRNTHTKWFDLRWTDKNDIT